MPRIEETAKALWGVYVGLSIVLVFILWGLGLTFFEALCHSLTTVSTGGFSTRNGSVGEFGLPLVEWVLVIFMFLGGINFALHYRALSQRQFRYLRSEEFRFWAVLLLFSIVGIVLFRWDPAVALEQQVRESAFQVISIGTSTGFGSADYESWGGLPQLVILALMVLGGCAGSTAGGVKVVRALIVIKEMGVQATKILHPKGIRRVKVDHASVEDHTVELIFGFFVLFVLTFTAGSLTLAATGMDFVSASSAMLSALSNIGPALGSVGPTDNYGHLPPLAKLVLTFCMLVGRLELVTVLVLFLPSYWRH